MFKGLYDNFKHWFRGGQVYFYSDPHFNDNEMRFLRKNYIGDEEQVSRINSKIGKCDTLVVLGDVGDIEWVSKVRGYKVLVMGNHDAGASKYKRETVLCDAEDEGAHRSILGNWVRDNKLFDEVYEGALMISPKIILSHEPLIFPYALNIHGHDHSGWDVKDGLHLNVCAEHIDYTPVSLKNIIESGKLKDVPDIHRITIDEAIKRKRARK